MLRIRTLPKLLSNDTNVKNVRTFFGYFRIAFNNVDQDRLTIVGPDRLCAEWVLKNGGSIKFEGRSSITDYNSLGPEGRKSPFLEEIDGTGSSIMAIGFEHFKNCNHIKKIILSQCKHMENEALEKLIYTKETLVDLSIVNCFNVNRSGLMTLKQLTNLQKLEISGLPYVKDMESVRKELIQSLPKCKIL